MNTTHYNYRLRYLNIAFFYTMPMSCEASLFAQVKIGANPASIGSNSSLEAEGINGKKVLVHKDNGTVIIENTAPGQKIDSLLAVDPAGYVRAISSDPILTHPSAASMKRSSNQTLSGGSQSIFKVTNLIEDDLGSVDLTNNEIIIKEPGTNTFNSTINVLMSGFTGRANIDAFVGKFTGSGWNAANQSEQNAADPLNAQCVNNRQIRLRVITWPYSYCIAGNPLLRLPM